MADTIANGECLYTLFGVDKSATADDIKKQYRKLALQYHPDRHSSASDKEREDVKVQFQRISFIYTVLSDETKRARYDRTGSFSDIEIDTHDMDILDYFRELYRSMVTEEAIDNFKQTYQGSEEERKDLLKHYTELKGDLDNIFAHMVGSSVDDEDRFRVIIQAAIDDGSVKAYKAFTHEPPKKRERRRAEAAREAKEAEEMLAEIQRKEGDGAGQTDSDDEDDEDDSEWSEDEVEENNKSKVDKRAPSSRKAKSGNVNEDGVDEDALKALIQNRQQKRAKHMDSFFDQLEAKLAMDNRIEMPKIQTEAKSDILFLQQQLRNFYTSYIAEHRMSLLNPNSSAEVPPEPRDEQADEAFLKAVGESMEEARGCSSLLRLPFQWIEEVFALASNNIEVNGIAYDVAMKAEDEFEPQDERLKESIKRLKKEKVELMSDAIEKRRQMPSQLESMVQDIVTAQCAAAYDGGFGDDSEADQRDAASDRLGVDNPKFDAMVSKTLEELERGNRLAKQVSQSLGTNLAQAQDLRHTVQRIRPTPSLSSS
ncbi:hypothetical protein RI367_000084 [Sorochytrium milnesiophthora]